ncbi:MAG: phosphoglycerate dehydrogenase [Coriobacteriales bacterium]|nr:phosphoglycerate dehydrogenase [Coriobacteriales bacterium]
MATYTYGCLNNIDPAGIAQLPANHFVKAENDETADVILVRSAKMHDMELPRNVRAIGRAGAGVNNIPLERCAERGIVVFNAPGANANAVKELVIAALMLSSRGIIAGADWVRDNQDDPDIAKTVEKAKKQFAGTEIKGKKLGVIGLGAIGALVANAALDLGMEVYGFDPYLSVDAAWRISNRVHHVTKQEELYQACDYITIHVPAMDSTKGYLNAESFAQMKDGVKILNFARDVLVDDDDMAAALESGKVGCYIFDFPNAKNVKMKNAIAIPHLGASTAEAETNCAVMVADQLRDYILNGNIKNSVNFPNCDMGAVGTKARIVVLHRNVPNMLSHITSHLGDAGINIADLTNKSRGNWAYTMVDTDSVVPNDIINQLRNADGIVRVRVIHND